MIAFKIIFYILASLGSVASILSFFLLLSLGKAAIKLVEGRAGDARTTKHSRTGLVEISTTQIPYNMEFQGKQIQHADTI